MYINCKEKKEEKETAAGWRCVEIKTIPDRSFHLSMMLAGAPVRDTRQATYNYAL